MQYHMRIMTELQVVGYPARRMTNGIPEEDPAGSADLFAAVQLVHIPDQAQYLVTDLETHAAALKKLLGKQQAKWEAYLRVQTDLIQAKRRQAYVDQGGVNELICELISDGMPVAEILKEAQNRKRDVQVRYPWPGQYRPDMFTAVDEEPESPVKAEAPEKAPAAEPKAKTRKRKK